VQVRFHFASSREALYVNDDIVLTAEEIPAASVDPVTGRVNAATTCQVALAVDRAQIEFFTRTGVFGAVEVTLSGASGEACEIWTSDYVTIRGVAAFRYRIE